MSLRPASVADGAIATATTDMRCAAAAGAAFTDLPPQAGKRPLAVQSIAAPSVGHLEKKEAFT
jgi:hypothetical protein